MFASVERALTDAERRQLESRLAAARREAALALVNVGGASAIVCGALAVATFLTVVAESLDRIETALPRAPGS